MNRSQNRRYVRLLFTREMPLSMAMRLWDGIFAMDPTFERDMVESVCVALIMRIRNLREWLSLSSVEVRQIKHADSEPPGSHTGRLRNDVNVPVTISSSFIFISTLHPSNPFPSSLFTRQYRTIHRRSYHFTKSRTARH